MSNLSTANVTPGDIILSPGRITHGGVDLGGTVDSITIGVKYDLADIMVDQYGKTPLNKKVSGHAYTVKCTLSELKNIDRWKTAFPSAVKIVNGGVKSMLFQMAIGDSLLDRALPLIVHPLENADADLNGDFNFDLAVCMEASEVKYGPEKQTGLAVEFVIFPNTAISPARFFVYGDPSNALTHASAAAAVAGGGNVGNGVISAEAAFDGSTKTEVITVKCVGATSGNDFFVSGTLSGAIGEFHIAASAATTHNFVSDVIAFTFTQGSTQSAFNDSYTIATTASNYA